MTKRQNKKRITKPESKPVVSSCELCDKQDNVRMVACDKCDKWYHYKCGNFDNRKHKKKDPWFCPHCKSKNDDELEQQSKNCLICGQAVTEEMIQCHHCELEFHISCVDLDTCQGRSPWKCDMCIEHLESLLNVTKNATHQDKDPVYGRQESLHKVPHLVDERQGHQNNQHQGARTRTLSTSSSRQNRWNFKRQDVNDHNQYVQQSEPQRSHERSADRISFPTTTIRSHHSHKSNINDVEMEYLQEEMNLKEKWARADRKLREERVQREREARIEKERRDIEERLEEERREKEFLERKYKLMRQQREFGETLSASSRTRYTHQWVNDQRNQSRYEEFDDNISAASLSRRIDELAQLKTPVVKEHSKGKPKKEELSTKRNSQGHVETPVLEDKMTMNIKPSTTLDTLQQPNKLEDVKQQSKLNEVGTTNAVTDGQDLITKRQIAARHIIEKKLTEFHGDPLQWTEWYNTYVSDTEMCGLSNGENLARLKKCLKGKAREAVKHKLLTPSAVPKIIETLKLLFGRPELIIKKLIDSVKELPAPKAEKLETLIEYSIAIQNISAEIEGANMHYHLVNPTLIEEIIEKLPMQTKLEWGRFMVTKDQVTVATLADWLYEQAKIACKVSSTTIFSDKSKDQKRHNQINVHQIEQSKNQMQVKAQNKDAAPQTQRKLQCKICEKSCTEPDKCLKFREFNLGQRWAAIKRHRLCQNCLKSHRGACFKTKQCVNVGCTHKHHSLLHRDINKKLESTKESASQLVKPVVEEIVKVNNNYHNVSVPNVFYRIVPVILYHREIAVETFAYLDEGSGGTLMQEDLAEELEMKGSQEQLCLLWTSNVHRIEQNSRRLDVKISGQGEFSKKYLMKGVRTVEDLGLPIQSIKAKLLKKRFPYLCAASIIDYNNAQPRILIGLPHASLCTQLKVIEGGENQPIASRSRIGWSIHGPTQGNHMNYEHNLNQHRIIVCHQQCEGDEELHRIVKEYFMLENFGVQVNNQMNMNSKEDQRALAILDKNTFRKNGRYQTSLLWKYDSFKMEDSYHMAKRRLICIERSKPKLITAINDNIMDYVSKGYARKLTSEELAVQRTKVGYLPIFSVIYPKKPEKFRMVFDAAAKVNGTSLNDMLLKGPAQLNLLIDVLRRFREHLVALCGDIIGMYHRIEICEEDKHVQRFLWRNGDVSKDPDVYVLEVMSFGATCSPSSAEYVKNKNAQEFEEELPRAVEAIVKNTYVDDMMDGANSVEEAIQLVTDVKRIHDHGGFQISKFLSNSPEVLKALGTTQDVVTKNFTMDPNQNTERVLGMFWNTKTDCFTFSQK